MGGDFSSSFQNCVSGAPLKAIEQSITRDSLKTFIGTRVRCTERFAEAHNALITAFGTILPSVITFGLGSAGHDVHTPTIAGNRPEKAFGALQENSSKSSLIPRR